MKKLLLASAALLLCGRAYANNCFWVGGAGTWDNTSITHWAPTTGGSATGCSTSNAAPTTGDTVTFDNNSGTGTVTTATAINNLNLSTIVFTSFAGTLDNSVNNDSFTFTAGMTASGSAAGTVNGGTGTWTFTGVANSVFNLTDSAMTWNFSSTPIVLAPSGNTSNYNLVWNGKLATVGSLTYTPFAYPNAPIFISNNGTLTLGTFTFGGSIELTNNRVYNVTNVVTTSTSSKPALLLSNSPASTNFATLALGTNTASLSWTGLQDIKFTTTGTTPTATNSWDFGTNSGITITPPSYGGGRISGSFGGYGFRP